MYLGRIITKNKNVETFDFVEVTNNKDLAINSTIPTLVIGKKNIQDLIGKENVHFLNKKINDNLYWTFGKTEQRNEYEHDLKEFNNMLMKQLVNGVKYKYLNIFTESLTTLKRFIRFIDGNENKVVFITNNIIYVYCKNTVYGISLSDLLYAGISKSKIIAKLKTNKHNTIIMNDYFLTKSIKKYINGSKILVPYMFFLQNS